MPTINLSKENRQLFILMLLAYTFSVAVRMMWVYFFADSVAFSFNEQIMINTNDGYFFAEGARDILAGFHQEGDGSPITQALAQLTAFLAFVLPFSFESVILYMPSFISSLIVIPVILMGHVLKQTQAGFIAALLASVMYSYYNRTMVGYYDTDMLNIVLPTFLLWSLVLAFQTRKLHYLLFMAIDIIIYRWWYPQSYALEFAFFGLVALYIIIYERKNVYLIKLAALMLFAMMNLPDLVRIALVAVVFFGFKNEKFDRYVYVVLALAGVLFVVAGGLDPVIGKLNIYVFRQELQSLGEGMQFHFFDVSNTISEAGQIPFEVFANRISGHTFSLLLSIIGYVWLVWRYKVMLLALPMVGLGFMAYEWIPSLVSGGGLRFTIYAIVPMALGVGFLVVQIASFIAAQAKNQKLMKIALMSIATVGLLYPNISHVYEYKVPTVMNNTEVKALSALYDKASKEDYTIAWWDYGYPIRYYSDTKTLADGGKHSGRANFPIALALTSTQDKAAKIARIAVETQEWQYNDENYTHWWYIPEVFKTHHLTKSNDFIEVISKSAISELPKKTRDIYFYLPFRMHNIYRVVDSFASVDALSGTKRTPSMMQLFDIRNQGDRLVLANGLYFSKRDGKLYQNNKPFNIKSFHRVNYDNKGALKHQSQVIDMRADLHMVLLPSYGKVMLLDDRAFYSTYVQLFFFENYDTHYFEPVVLNPMAKIYKLKL